MDFINTSLFEIDKNTPSLMKRHELNNISSIWKRREKKAYKMNKNVVSVFIKLQLYSMSCLHKKSIANASTN
jgi:hypothetical protein